MRRLKTVWGDAALYMPKDTGAKRPKIFVDIVGEFLTLAQARKLVLWLSDAIEEVDG